MFQVAILDDYQQVSQNYADFASLSDACEITVFDQYLGESDDDVVTALENFDVIACMRERTPFNRARIERLKHLKLLVTTGKRNASIDLDAASDHGVMVCGTAAPGHAASELAWALTLGLQRQLVAEHVSVQTGLWQTTVGRDCHGLTMGILGLGRHGSNVARFAKAFNMNVIAWSTNLDQARCDECSVQYVDKETLFKESDVLSIHLAMGRRNRSLVGAAELALMKSDALLINTSRGPIVDEAALLNALQSGSIGGAGLDVFDQEPLPLDHPLRKCPNTLLTSHVGYVTEQTYQIFYDGTLKAIQGWLNDSPVGVLS